MKVAFDVAQTCVERAGCSWYADALAHALAAQSEVELTLLHHFGSWCNHATDTGTRIEGIDSALWGCDEDMARAFWRTVAHEGLPERPDIVHSNCFDAPAVPGSRLVFTIHDVSFWTAPQFATEATRIVCQRGMLDALERAAGLAFVSEATRAEFERILPGWLGVSERPTAILSGASRFPERPRTREAETGPWLCVGSIEPRKNHVALLDAYTIYRSAVKQPRELILAGSHGWNSDAVHERIRNAGPDQGIVHVGYVGERRLQQLYATSFCLVCPSWYEGFGLPLVEAFAHGLPVVCSDIPSLREVGGAAPTYVPPEDVGGLAAAMIALHDHPHAAAEAAHRSSARHLVHSWKQTAHDAIEFYQRLLTTEPLRAP